MLDFNTPTLSDISNYAKIVSNSNMMGCDVSPANTYLWRNEYDIKLAYYKDFIIKAYGDNNGDVSGYCIPIGSGDLKGAIDQIIIDAKDRGIKPLIGLLTEQNVELLKSYYGEQISIEEKRNDFDYIYLRENLANLSGKKYHGKRNHISQFKRLHPDYKYTKLCRENFSDALMVAAKWCDIQREYDGESFTADYSAVEDAFLNFDNLKLFGGIIYVDNSAVAMTVASEINSQVVDVHFEKSIIDGGYPVINNEFSSSLSQYKYINREEDMGLEGLRKSKLSYKPDILLAKYEVILEK